MFISDLHVGVIVHSLQESIKFYTELLGLSVDGIVESSGLGVTFSFLSHAGQTLELSGTRTKGPNKNARA